MQDTVGHEQYGVFAALFSLSFLFATISDLGINQYLTKKLAGEPEKIKDIFPAALGLKLILFILYPTGMTIAGYVLGYTSEALYYLWILSFFQCGVQLVLFFRANFQAQQKFFIDSFASVLDKSLLIIFLLIVFQINMTVENFIYARLFSILAAALLLYALYVMSSGWHNPTLSRKKLFPVIYDSLPFAMMTILYSFNERVDQVMVERLLGGKEAGLYAGAYRWLDAVMMYLWIVLPLFFARFAFLKKDKQELDRMFKIGHIIAFLPMCFVSGFVLLYPEKMFLLFTHSSVEEIGTMTVLLQILFLASLIHGLFAIYSTLLTSVGYEKQTSVMIFISVLLNIALNLIFVPMYGVYASAWATVSSTVFLSISYVYYINKQRIVTIPVMTVLKLIVVCALFMATYYALTFTSLEWYVNSFIAGLTLCALSWVIGLLNIKELKV